MKKISYRINSMNKWIMWNRMIHRLENTVTIETTKNNQVNKCTIRNLPLKEMEVVGVHKLRKVLWASMGISLLQIWEEPVFCLLLIMKITNLQWILRKVQMKIKNHSDQDNRIDLETAEIAITTIKTCQ